MLYPSRSYFPHIVSDQSVAMGSLVLYPAPLPIKSCLDRMVEWYAEELGMVLVGDSD